MIVPDQIVIFAARSAPDKMRVLWKPRNVRQFIQLSEENTFFAGGWARKFKFYKLVSRY